MMLFQGQRPRFFEGQYLGAEDLTAAVAYGRIQNARHALGAHTWGIAMGLQLKETPLPGGKVEVHMLPGYAWDGFGRPVVVLAPYRIPEALFSGITFQPGVDDTDAGRKGRLFPVWLRYDEAATQNVRPGFEVCDTDDPRSRVRETFGVEVGTKPAHFDRHDLIRLAGQAVDAEQALKRFDPAAPVVYDESVPHQMLPEEGERARWLIPIGYVRWLPVQDQPGYFVSRDDSDRPAGSSDPFKDSDKIRALRRYIGVVAEALEAADGAIRLRDRYKAPSGFFSKQATQGFLSKDPAKPYYQTPGPDLVWVEGPLRVEGDARLAGSSLDFRDRGGEDHDTPLLIRRVGDAGKPPGQTGDRTLQILLGPEAQTDNRLTVGPLKDDGSLAPHLVVRSDGHVGIGTESPNVTLHVIGDLTVEGTARSTTSTAWTLISDLRLKKNVEPLTRVLERLLRLRGVRFEWSAPERMGNRTGPQMGLIADEVETVFPEWVGTGPGGYKELTLQGFEALVIEALRELQAEIERLKARLASVEKRPRREAP
jgi:hypothetical protein